MNSKIAKPNTSKVVISKTAAELKDLESIHAYYQNIIKFMPNNVYWLDTDCITQGCNENVLKLVGLDSLEQFVGITYEKMGKLAGWTEGQAESFKKDDMEVMSTGIAKIHVEEPPVYDEADNPFYYVSSRVPLLDERGKIIGVVGISVDITKRKNAEDELKKAKKKTDVAMMLMNKDTLKILIEKVKNQKIQLNIEGQKISITSREAQCLLYLVRGETAKYIAKEMNLSPRTIEGYIETLKSKINTSFKTLLASKAIHGGLLEQLI